MSGFFGRHPGFVGLAARCLRAGREVVLAHHEELPGDAAYVWRPVRGGGMLVIDADGSVLFGASSIDRDTLLEAFRQGKRTDLGLFD